jgi:hypothetical protein
MMSTIRRRNATRKEADNKENRATTKSTAESPSKPSSMFSAAKEPTKSDSLTKDLLKTLPMPMTATTTPATTTALTEKKFDYETIREFDSYQIEEHNQKSGTSTSFSALNTLLDSEKTSDNIYPIIQDELGQTEPSAPKTSKATVIELSDMLAPSAPEISKATVVSISNELLQKMSQNPFYTQLNDSPKLLETNAHSNIKPENIAFCKNLKAGKMSYAFEELYQLSQNNAENFKVKVDILAKSIAKENLEHYSSSQSRKLLTKLQSICKGKTDPLSDTECLIILEQISTYMSAKGNDNRTLYKMIGKKIIQELPPKTSLNVLSDKDISQTFNHYIKNIDGKERYDALWKMNNLIKNNPTTFQGLTLEWANKVASQYKPSENQSIESALFMATLKQFIEIKPMDLKTAKCLFNQLVAALPRKDDVRLVGISLHVDIKLTFSHLIEKIDIAHSKPAEVDVGISSETKIIKPDHVKFCLETCNSEHIDSAFKKLYDLSLADPDKFNQLVESIANTVIAKNPSKIQSDESKTLHQDLKDISLTEEIGLRKSVRMLKRIHEYMEKPQNKFRKLRNNIGVTMLSSFPLENIPTKEYEQETLTKNWNTLYYHRYKSNFHTTLERQISQLTFLKNNDPAQFNEMMAKWVDTIQKNYAPSKNQSPESYRLMEKLKKIDTTNFEQNQYTLMNLICLDSKFEDKPYNEKSGFRLDRVIFSALNYTLRTPLRIAYENCKKEIESEKTKATKNNRSLVPPVAEESILSKEFVESEPSAPPWTEESFPQDSYSTFTNPIILSTNENIEPPPENPFYQPNEKTKKKEE